VADCERDYIVLKLRKFGLSLALALTFGMLPGLSQTLPSDITADQTIPNLGVAKLQIQEYVKSGRYAAEIKRVTDSARAYLAENLPKHRDHKPAIVLDIDETSLSNLPNIEELDFGYLSDKWNAWVSSAKAPAIEGTLEFYKYARSQNVAVIFLTGRGEAQRSMTERNLRASGYDGWERLILKPTAVGTIGDFKAGERKRLTDEGYHIIVNMGDQISDLTGGYADGEFKLPNPMYFVR
jgi:acid phosphatase